MNDEYLSIENARRIGRRESVVAMLLCLFGTEFLLGMLETGGDFANGIIFFIRSRSNVRYVFLLILLFSVPYLFGGKVGQQILMENKHFFWTPLKYGLLTALAVLIYGVVLLLQYTQSNAGLGDLQVILLFIPYFLIFGIVYGWVSGLRIKKFRPTA
ncbi:MAG TPA: hypothetical protein VIU12_28425 [Chryseolinea sp.]